MDAESTARAYLLGARKTFGMTPDQVAAMELVSKNPVGSWTVVVLRQTYDGLPAASGGLALVAVKNGKVQYVNTSLAPMDAPAAGRSAGARSTTSRPA